MKLIIDGEYNKNLAKLMVCTPLAPLNGKVHGLISKMKEHPTAQATARVAKRIGVKLEELESFLAEKGTAAVQPLFDQAND